MYSWKNCEGIGYFGSGRIWFRGGICLEKKMDERKRVKKREVERRKKEKRRRRNIFLKHISIEKVYRGRKFGKGDVVKVSDSYLLCLKMFVIDSFLEDMFG